MFYGHGCIARLGARFGDDISTLDGEPKCKRGDIPVAGGGVFDQARRVLQWQPLDLRRLGRAEPMRRHRRAQPGPVPSVLVELGNMKKPGRLGTDEYAGGSSEVRRRGDVAHPRFGGLQLPRRHGACTLPALEHPAAAAD